MFGYIRPVKSELLVKDSEIYSATYCGLCRYGGKNISHLTRWLLNYDFVLLALLRASLTDETLCVERHRCPYKLKKKNCVCAEESFDFVSSVFGLLSYGKLLDDINDEKGFKRFCRRLVKPIFKHIAKKSDRFEGMKDIIKNGLNMVSDAEKRKEDSIDRAADGFAVMMKQITSYGLEGEKRIIAESCGYHIGRFIYIADAYDDILDDEKSSSYNPLLLKYGSAEAVIQSSDAITETLYDSLNAFSNAYALCEHRPLNEKDRLIYNITELGGREAVRRIKERLTAPERNKK